MVGFGPVLLRSVLKQNIGSFIFPRNLWKYDTIMCRASPAAVSRAAINSGQNFTTARQVEVENSDSVDTLVEDQHPAIDEFGRVYATGRRKTSTARVWIMNGSGQFIVNGRRSIDYFNPLAREHCIEPLIQSKQIGLFDVWCTVKGGGTSGQSGAIRLGISRALNAFDPNLRKPLKTAGMLTRDSRRVERKKAGRKKARKQYQWVKR